MTGVSTRFLKNLSLTYKLSVSQPAICYHSISGNKKPFQGNLHNISKDNFFQQLKTLSKKYTFLPITEFLNEKTKLNRHKISAITFDDGYKNILEVASPVLELLNLPFTIFFNTKLLDGTYFWRDKIRVILERNLVLSFKEYLKKENEFLFDAIDWNRFYSSTKVQAVNSKQLESVIDAFLKEKEVSLISEKLYLDREDIAKLPTHLASIGNHTVNHYYLSSLIKEDQLYEIGYAKTVIDNLICETTNVFAIPFGGIDAFNQDTIDILNGLGYKGFLMTNQNQFGQKIPTMPYNSYGMQYSNRILFENRPFTIYF